MAAQTIRAILNEAAARLAHLASGRRDAELLLQRALGCDRAWLLTHGDERITEAQRHEFDACVTRRSRHEPVQYIVGEQEFFGLAMCVTPDVLIPRPETEHLVEATLERVPRDSPLAIADVGTGSGAIAVALAHALPLARVTALDNSSAALAVARQNAERHEVGDRMRFLESDLLSAVRGEQFFAVVANPPYVAEGEELEPQVRDYEPHSALFAGPTGLDVYRRLIPEAWDALVPGGWLLMEMGHGQRDSLAELFLPGSAAHAWEDVSFVPDLQGIPRVAMARRAV